MPRAELEKLSVSAVPAGPRPSDIARRASALMTRRELRSLLGRARAELLDFRVVEPDDPRGVKYQRLLGRPRRFRATVFDYTRNRTLLATGRLDGRRPVEVEDLGTQPRPSTAEFEAAEAILRRDDRFREAIRSGALQPYRPMPPLVLSELPDGTVERTIAVGLIPKRGRRRHEIVGVNMVRQAVVRYESLAPPFAVASQNTCHPPPDANQATESSAAGSVSVTVRQGSTVLWKFYAVRPAASSGTNGSGIELRQVFYRGRKVLYRAHLPILNVRYDNDECGPYRDWQDQEGMIQAAGTDVAPGFRVCPSPAQTILDTGSDTGNFLGVAIYVDGLEVVLVSEMEAGWYRYISEWRLHADGTIRPRFGFDAVQNSCTCKVHHHHAYWRFDFDIETAHNNLVREFNDPPLIGSSKWHTKSYEIRRMRNPGRKRRWRVTNKSSKRGYTIIPGSNDGVATATPDWPFSAGDVWIVRYRSSELDDGQGFTTDPAKARADIDKFVNGQSIDGRDVVIWYGAHFTHDEGGPEVSHIVGPDLKPHAW